MRTTDNSPKWLKDLAKDNMRKAIELYNRQHKADSKNYDICLHLLHNEEYKRKKWT